MIREFSWRRAYKYTYKYLMELQVRIMKHNFRIKNFNGMSFQAFFNYGLENLRGLKDDCDCVLHTITFLVP